MSHDSDASKALRSPLANARDIGTAHRGAHHWWVERMTSLALIPLCLWLLASLLFGLTTYDAAGVAAWLSHPVPALAMAFFLVVGILHGQMGMQVVIEDYCHTHWVKYLAIILTKTIFYVAALAALFALAKLHFAGL